MEAYAIAMVSGLVGGAITAIAAVAAIRVELKYLRRDVDYALERIGHIDRQVSANHAGR